MSDDSFDFLYAEDANALTKSSKANSKKEKEEASIKYLKKKIEPEIKKAANAGGDQVVVYIDYNEYEPISLKCITDFLENHGYHVSCTSAKVMDPSFKTTRLSIHWGEKKNEW